ncbi:undecaprenyl/decaprenyl-phosphate alpha-N-acetylglucosaminyl 1-phosphate transferase [Dysgonomonas capnocytophagoides]|uniref:Undecaprenyl/decaprenyl-phosphate alpha-N-acetylglucosaminyl 1-phosphate transferase n=1 Tax=Dysgonomonas capnocytophagoides TaxID=45254 RepID=A0A4Y8L6I9_9BACT|nr:MraY family glycosyltransferase [Dysgonomonas capnocytophagoides]TFD97764.1 undecaprenyl/decaprenyl-phosphate alpha-N-acetylglucosaminyl 1-phosphate transferase [Dysgonomonas capnocytophagoides]
MENIKLYNILIIVGACVASVIIEMMVLPRIIYIAKKKRLFDLPDKRKKHSEPIPRLGGISFTPVILLVSLFCLFIRFIFQFWDEELFFYRIPETILLVCGLLVIYLLGAKDDLVGVSFKKKFVIQFIASLCIVGSGVYINNLYGLLGFHEIPGFIGVVLSIGLIMFTTNAINLIDGADGLASGISAVALLIYGIMFSIYGMWTYAGIAFITLGLLAPFFYYNFAHPTRKIFMGDTGSLTLGFLLAFMILRISKYPPAVEIVPGGLILLVLSALFIPLFDAFKVMVVRIAKGKGPFSPDRNHIHHKLIDLGFSKKKAVFLIVMTGALLVVANWILLWYLDCNVLLILDLSVGVLVNVFIYRRIKRKEYRKQRQVEEELLELDS